MPLFFITYTAREKRCNLKIWFFLDWLKSRSYIALALIATLLCNFEWSCHDCINMASWYTRGHRNTFSLLPSGSQKVRFKNMLEANQNKNNCLVINFLDKLNFPALFSVIADHFVRTQCPIAWISPHTLQSFSERRSEFEKMHNLMLKNYKNLFYNECKIERRSFLTERE